MAAVPCWGRYNRASWRSTVNALSPLPSPPPAPPHPKQGPRPAAVRVRHHRHRLLQDKDTLCDRCGWHEGMVYIHLQPERSKRPLQPGPATRPSPPSLEPPLNAPPPPSPHRRRPHQRQPGRLPGERAPRLVQGAVGQRLRRHLRGRAAGAQRGLQFAAVSAGGHDDVPAHQGGVGDWEGAAVGCVWVGQGCDQWWLPCTQACK
jgi:hypothetical protein